MEESWGKVAELLPFDYFCLDDRNDWKDFVDDLMVPDVPEDPDSALDIVKESGIPRELEPGRYVLNVQGHRRIRVRKTSSTLSISKTA